MCLAVPGRIDSFEQDHGLLMAWVDYGGTRRRVCVEYAQEAGVGDYVIVHAGFAISILDEGSALESLEVLRQLANSQGGSDQ